MISTEVQTDGQLNVAELERIADVLMGAAHADGKLEGVEAEAVRRLLGGLLGGKPLPRSVDERLATFRDETFDLEAACAALELRGEGDRRGLLSLLAMVTDCDDVHDLDESEYIRRVASLIGAQPEEYRGLVVEVISIRSLTLPP